MRVAVKNHALPVFKKNRIALLLCIFESIIQCDVIFGGVLECNGIITIGTTKQCSVGLLE